MKKWLCFCLCFAMLCGGVLPTQAEETIYGTVAQTFTAQDNTLLPYRIFLPEQEAEGDGFAVYIHFHGVGESGNDNIAQTTTGMELVRRITTAKKEEAIVILPQCPAEAPWVDVAPSVGVYSVDVRPISPYLQATMELLAWLQTQHTIDANRIYISGLSMGGYAVWDLLARYPGVFAAAIPVCGGGDPSKAPLMTDVAIRTFHSADDPIVPVDGTRAMVQAIKEAGGTVSYTEYTNKSHSCWSAAYTSSGILNWVFSQTRADDSLPPPPQPSPLLLGDLNEDEEINATDALLVLQHAVKIVTLDDSHQKVADVTKDGVIDATDALRILLFAVQKIPAL